MIPVTVIKKEKTLVEWVPLNLKIRKYAKEINKKAKKILIP